jgi:hypothetical protein
MIQGFNYLEFFRSLTFGGLVGAGIAGIIFLKIPYLQTITSLPAIMAYGGVAGAGAQRAIESVINFVIAPFGRFITYYEKLIELQFLYNWDKVSYEQYTIINAKLTQARFLGALLPDKPDSLPELPPKP